MRYVCERKFPARVPHIVRGRFSTVSVRETSNFFVDAALFGRPEIDREPRSAPGPRRSGEFHDFFQIGYGFAETRTTSSFVFPSSGISSRLHNVKLSSVSRSRFFVCIMFFFFVFVIGRGKYSDDLQISFFVYKTSKSIRRRNDI